MGIDISIKGVSRKDFISRNIWDKQVEILEGDDWMCLKNCTYLERLIVRGDYPDKEVMDAHKKHYWDYDVSKPFRIVDLENAIESLKGLDEQVNRMPFCPAGWEWMNKENKAIVEVVSSIYDDVYNNFVFPWQEEAKEPDMGMGSWRLQEILNRAIVNAKKLPEDTVFFIRWC